MNFIEYTKQLFASMLVFIGIILIGQNYASGSHLWNLIWPMFILLPGTLLIFESHLTSKPFSAKLGLFIGAFMVLLSCIFFIQIFTAWDYSNRLYFLYPLAIPVSLAVVYSYKHMAKWLRMVFWAWIVVSIICFLIGNNLQNFVWALILMLAGIWLVMGARSNKNVSK